MIRRSKLDFMAKLRPKLSTTSCRNAWGEDVQVLGSGKRHIPFFSDLHRSSGYIVLLSKRRPALVSRKMSRILVVDDHEPVRRSIQTLLGAREGWVVCGEASDGIQAVKEAESLRPDLIIMDVSMPNMNGLDAAKIILREVRESRILII
jgi:hypothetical protein